MPAGLAKVEGMGVENWKTEWCDTPWTFKNPGWSDDVPAHRVEGQSGDCVQKRSSLDADVNRKPNKTNIKSAWCGTKLDPAITGSTYADNSNGCLLSNALYSYGYLDASINK